MKFVLALLLCLLAPLSLAGEIVNVYNWAEYMPNEVIRQFERETGIQVNYTEYDSNETMYAKLKSNPRLGYDVIFPSTYYVQRMAKENMLTKLNKSQLPNIKNLNPSLMRKPFDPNNDYSVPYLWGTAGVVINKKYINPSSVTGWADFWQPRFKDQLLLFDDMRQVFSIALFRLGYSINETNPKRIEEAFHLLQKLWPNIKLFSLEAQQNIYIDEDVYIGMGYSGEAYNITAENPNLVYIYPKEGFEAWMDSIAIPKNAPHLNAAHQFINFILRPDIAAKISALSGFSTPNQAAIPLLPEKMRGSYIVNPDNKILQRAQYINDLGDTNAIYEKYWNRLKIGA